MSDMDYRGYFLKIQVIKFALFCNQVYSELPLTIEV